MIDVLVFATLVNVAPAPDPYQIFARARAYWLAQTYPAGLEYQVVVAVTEGGKARTERYDTAYDALTGQISVDEVSDYERAHPVNPTGVNINFAIPFLSKAINKPLPPIDWLGVPRLAPTYSFGMAPFVPSPAATPFDSAALVAEIRKKYHDPDPRASASPNATPSIPEIATVVARNRDYTITYVGNDTIDGHGCFHLTLQPDRDPGKLRIRQAWIDETTYATWQLVDAGNFRSTPGGGIPWTIHFADVNGAHYIREEVADRAISIRGERFMSAAVSFDFNPVSGPRLYAQNIVVPLLDEP